MPRKNKVTEKPMVLSMRDAKAGTGRQMIPADNVDADGKSWATVGENIRHGAKEVLNGKEMIDAFVSAVLGTDSEVITLECDLSTEIISFFPKHHNISSGQSSLVFKAPFMILAVNMNNITTIEQTINLQYGPGHSNCYLKLRTARQPGIKVTVTVGIAK